MMPCNSPQARSHWRRWDLVALGIALLLAAVLRLGWPGVNSFALDEAHVSLLALRMARQGAVPTVGIPSSAGVPNAPLFVWLMALPFALTNNPLAVTQVVAAMNVLAILPLWVLAKRLYGPWGAMSTALLYAASPFGVFYSRSIWSQDLLAPMAILCAWLVWRTLERPRAATLIPLMALAGMAWQVHYGAAVLAPLTLWFVLRQRLWRPGLACILAGAGLALAAALPFGLTLMRDEALREAALALAARPATWTPEALRLWVQVASGCNWEWLPLGWDWHWPAWLQRLLGLTSLASGLLTAIGAVVCLLTLLRRRSQRSPAALLRELVLLWALAVPLLFIRSRTPVYHQYLLTALPALTLLAGGAAAARQQGARWRGPAVATLALLIALTQGTAWCLGLTANARQLQVGGMGTPLTYMQAATARLRSDLPVYGHVRSDAPTQDADAAALSVLLWDRPLSLVNGERVLLLPPEGQGAQLYFPFPDSPALELARQIAQPSEEMRLPRRSNEPPYTVLTVQGAAPQGAPPTAERTLANGVALVRWETERQDGSLRLLTVWQVGPGYVSGRYHQLNHLVAEGSEVPLQVGDADLSSQSWSEGNLVASWVTYTDVPADASLLVGMYTWPDLERVPTTTGQQAIRLTP
ncbi:MAG: glycosyltransferase family 39 protein [Anaerolineae bacterium]|jgi:hypothetical protein|nr:glycosyltransferase family 39 protein [Chloroflexota bacterium]